MSEAALTVAEQTELRVQLQVLSAWVVANLTYAIAEKLQKNGIIAGPVDEFHLELAQVIRPYVPEDE